MPAAPSKQPRGRPNTYSDRLILKAFVIMIVRRVYSASGLLDLLDQADAVSQQLRVLLCKNGQFPSRRTWERRLARLPAQLPGLMGGLGRALVELLQPWAQCGRAAAMDSTALKTGGGVWHKKHRYRGRLEQIGLAWLETASGGGCRFDLDIAGGALDGCQHRRCHRCPTVAAGVARSSSLCLG